MATTDSVNGNQELGSEPVVSPRPALEGDPWPADVELDHAIARYIKEHGALVNPDVVEWLSSQCMRRMYKQCTTARCLYRGGYKNNPPFSPDIATCEPHEILNAIGITQPTSDTGERSANA